MNKKWSKLTIMADCQSVIWNGQGKYLFLKKSFLWNWNAFFSSGAPSFLWLAHKHNDEMHAENFGRCLTFSFPFMRDLELQIVLSKLFLPF